MEGKTTIRTDRAHAESCERPMIGERVDFKGGDRYEKWRDGEVRRKLDVHGMYGNFVQREFLYQDKYDSRESSCRWRNRVENLGGTKVAEWRYSKYLPKCGEAEKDTSLAGAGVGGGKRARSS